MMADSQAAGATSEATSAKPSASQAASTMAASAAAQKAPATNLFTSNDRRMVMLPWKAVHASSSRAGDPEQGEGEVSRHVAVRHERLSVRLTRPMWHRRLVSKLAFFPGDRGER